MKTLVLVFHPHLEKSQVNRKLMDAANETGDVTVRSQGPDGQEGNDDDITNWRRASDKQP